MKARWSVLLVLIVIIATQWSSPLLASQPVTNCVVVTTRHYYAREIHNDFMVREIELCLSEIAKSISYELPALPEPLTIESTDGATVSVSVTDLSNPEQVILFMSGQSVTFELPPLSEATRYQLKVEVPRDSDGVIIGRFGQQEVGKILLLDSQTRYSQSLTAALGGISGEWWFETRSAPAGATVRLAIITTPTDTGSFTLISDSWLRVRDIRLNQPAVIFGEEWSSDGYFALRATFSR